VDIGQLRLGTYGICAAIGFFLAWFAFKRDLTRRGLPVEAAGPMVVGVTLAGLAGARLYFMLETPRALHGGIAGQILEPTGLSWLGGLIAGTIALCVFSWHYTIPLLTVFDMAGPIGALVYAVGRVGCLFAGDGDYGSPTSLPWGMTFPRGIVPTYETVHPTPIYEALAGIVLFIFLWRLGGRTHVQGMVGGAYLVLSGAARFMVEFIKLNPRLYWGLTNAQVVSLVCVIAGTGLLLAVWFKSHRDGHSFKTATAQSGSGSQCG
jgi:phosphatidylglycerol:prolipoprotein diacylglycerol transferase